MWRPAILMILCWTAAAQPPIRPIVLHAARLLDVETGRMHAPGEVLVVGDRISEAGTAVTHPAGAEIIDLGDRILLPGLIDADDIALLPKVSFVMKGGAIHRHP